MKFIFSPPEIEHKQDAPLAITEVLKEESSMTAGILSKVVTGIYLFPNKDHTEWRFVNLKKGHISNCSFPSRADAIEDLKKNYSDRIEMVRFKNVLA
jgi:hypothetical protein